MGNVDDMSMYEHWYVRPLTKIQYLYRLYHVILFETLAEKYVNM